MKICSVFLFIFLFPILSYAQNNTSCELVVYFEQIDSEIRYRTIGFPPVMDNVYLTVVNDDQAIITLKDTKITATCIASE